MNAKLMLFSALGVSIFLAFQNCGRALPIQTQTSESPSKTLTSIDEDKIATLGQINKIDFTKDFSTASSVVDSAYQYSIDLRTSTLRINQSGISCMISSRIISEIRTLIDGASICEPHVQVGTVQCMAIAIADITLHEDKLSYPLRSYICGNGYDLCDGKGGKLRELVRSIPEDQTTLCIL